MIAIIDYGMGNLGSISNMLARIGAQAVVTAEPGVLAAADKLILPGVGAFDRAMENLGRLNLVPVLNELVLGKRKPILGICLGMQLLSKRSDEGQLPGLGWIDAETVRFRFEGEHANLRVPHMGWNSVAPVQRRSVLDDLPEDPRFYFVHSYHVQCRDASDVLATTTYGITFHSAVRNGNVVGTQFHPEKSHKYGMKLLRNFVEADEC